MNEIKCKPFFLFIVVILISSGGKGQDLDSLRKGLDAGELDTVWVNKFNASAKALSARNPGEAIKYGRNAASLAEELGFEKGLAIACKNIGTAYFFTSKYDSTEHYWKRSLEIFSHSGGKGLADANNNMGVLYFRTNRIDSARKYYEQAMNIRQEIGDSAGVASTRMNLGVMDFNQGKYDRAIDHYLYAFRIWEKANNQKGIGDVFSSLGQVFIGLMDYEKALNCFRKSLRIRQELGEVRSVASCYNNMAVCYGRLGNYDLAEVYYLKYLKSAQALGDTRGVAGVLMNLGIILKKAGEIDRSRSFYQQALEEFERLEDYKGMASCNVNMGLLNLEEGQLMKCKAFLMDALFQARKAKAKDIEQQTLDLLAITHARLGDYRSAYEYKKSYVEVHDSIFTVKTREKIAELQEKYEFEKMSHEIELLNKESQINEKRSEIDRIYRNIALITAGALLGILFLIHNRYQLRKKVFRQREVILQKEKEELRLMAAMKQTEVESKNRELSTYAISTLHKNQMLNELQEKLADFRSKDSDKVVKELKRLIGSTNNMDRDWKNFKIHFQAVHPDFLDKLKREFPNLSANDLRSCAYMRMNLSTKEIATLMNITSKSARMNRYRLKKKMGLQEVDSLPDYIKVM